MIGTFNNSIAIKMAEAAKLLEMDKVAFICTNNQYDEITLTNNTRLVEVNSEGEISTREINASTFNYSEITLDHIKGGSPKENSQIILDIFKNKSTTPQRNVVVANASLALYTSGNYSTLAEAQNVAEDSINSGKALEKLNQLIDFGKTHG